MSFILDALKKSEQERQREAVPAIGDLPLVVQQTRTSAWVVAIIVALAVGLVALAWAWWQATSPVGTAAVGAASETAARTAEPRGRAASERAAEPATRTITRSLASEAARAAAPTPPQRAEPTRITAPAPAAGVVVPAPMSILEAREAGMAVPELRLELLVFSNDPAQRFVYINSSKYLEGETLQEGPRLVEITNEGAILSYRGQSFLLPQN